MKALAILLLAVAGVAKPVPQDGSRHVNMSLITYTNTNGVGYCAAIMMPPDDSGYPAYVSWISPPLGEFDAKAWEKMPTVFRDNMAAQAFVTKHCYPSVATKGK